MAEPLRHDEQMFFPAGILFGSGDLYRDFGFNHLPNLPIMLAAVDALFPARPFLAGRALVFVAWLAAAALVAAIGWRATRSRMIAALGVLLLVTNPLLIDRSGTLITNNFLPIPFALGGLLAFLAGADRERPHAALLFLSGFLLAVAIGLKANFVAIMPPFAVAALLVPQRIGLARRLRLVTLPLIAGGIIGGLPTLYAFAVDSAGFAAHVFSYHRGPHHAWAMQQEDLVVSFKDRFLLAQSVWGSGATLLTALVIVVAGLQLLRRGWRPRWPVMLTAGLVLAGIMVAFVPTPSFPQYFTPPLPFAIVLMLLLLGELGPGERTSAAPLLVAVAVLAIVTGGPRLLAELPLLARPAKWTGNSVHRDSVAIVAAARGRPIATLSPVYALEAGGTIYPELAAGPFVYRVADLIPVKDRRHYRLVSPAALPALLDANPPGAVLVGLEEHLDDGLREYASTRGYVRQPLERPELELYVRP
ncbi:hypothetical protein GCM10011529_21070 [Polymorphobacter glacialis]|uniref:Uncharacterized protein n=1 Tax=Sandarakinorhabdus glacialis TaxID=1614636 RepID=A0A916ZUX3_9SPHN|nr:hypothetical protein [Polymorphobacter glacialis]GGE14474.1 hypothetical protein GCM10011529_21070 [Polymorphobacter glacialis]